MNKASRNERNINFAKKFLHIILQYYIMWGYPRLFIFAEMYGARAATSSLRHELTARKMSGITVHIIIFLV
jgi:hypothetical protein